jgi:hypothetical protein
MPAAAADPVPSAADVHAPVQNSVSGDDESSTGFEIMPRKRRGGHNVAKVCSNCHQFIKGKAEHPGGRGGQYCQAEQSSGDVSQGHACSMRGCPCAACEVVQNYRLQVCCTCSKQQ